MFCQEASGLWGLQRPQIIFFALPGLLDGSWASPGALWGRPGAPSWALGPLWTAKGDLSRNLVKSTVFQWFSTFCDFGSKIHPRCAKKSPR